MKHSIPITCLPARALGWLLHIANSDRHSIYRTNFYGLKDRILNARGKRTGWDIQEIVDTCWDCEGTGWQTRNGHKELCRRCNRGVYRRRRIMLERYELGGFTFHRPRPDLPCDGLSGTATINGRVRHRDYGLFGAEITLWFLLLVDPGLWWQDMRGSSYCYPRFWPLLRLQKVLMAIQGLWNYAKRQPRCCTCSKPFRNWGLFWARSRGSVYLQCRNCERRPRYAEEVPF